MKTSHFLLAIISGMFAGACHKPGTIGLIEQNITRSPVSNISITDKTTRFTSTDKSLEKSCSVLNDTIDRLVASQVRMIEDDASQLKRMFPDSVDRPSFQYELYLTDSVFMATPDLISLRLTCYQYTGGAHGITQFYSFNYDVKKETLLTPSEILNYTDSLVIDQSIAASFKNPFGCFSQIPTLSLMSVLNISETDVCFSYEHYILGPYACGTVEVSVPRKELPLKIR